MLSQQYYNENDHLTFFINNHCEKDDKFTVLIARFRESFMKDRSISIRHDRLKELMIERGFKSKIIHGNRLFAGIKLK